MKKTAKKENGNHITSKSGNIYVKILAISLCIYANTPPQHYQTGRKGKILRTVPRKIPPMERTIFSKYRIRHISTSTHILTEKKESIQNWDWSKKLQHMAFQPMNPQNPKGCSAHKEGVIELPVDPYEMGSLSWQKTSHETTNKARLLSWDCSGCTCHRLPSKVSNLAMTLATCQILQINSQQLWHAHGPPG